MLSRAAACRSENRPNLIIPKRSPEEYAQGGYGTVRAQCASVYDKTRVPSLNAPF